MKKQKLWSRFVEYLVTFFAGAFLLSTFSLLQKIIIGFPLPLKPITFLIPVFIGGFSGLALGLSYIRLRTSQEQMGGFLDTIDDLVQIVNQEGDFLFVNRAWRTTLGYSSREIQNLKVFDIIHPAHLEHCTTFLQQIYDGEKENGKFKTVLLSKEGRPIYLEGKVNCRFENNQAVSTQSIFSNITERHEAEGFQRLAASVFEKTSEGIVITDKNMNVSFVNAAFEKITGYTEEVLGKNIQQFLPSANGAQANSTEIEKTLAEKGSWQGELWSRRKTGEEYPIQISISAINSPDNEITNYARIFSDISIRKENEARLYHLATHDTLTALPNREMFSKFAAASLLEAKEKNTLFAILFLDLDNFKEINDQYGHHTGDTLLGLLSQRLLNQTRQNDIVARLGGDEFTILISNIKNKTEANSAAENILKVITKPFHLDRNTIHISASIGISLYSKNSEISSLLNDADQAMYQAKRGGKNRIRFIKKVN